MTKLHYTPNSAVIICIIIYCQENKNIFILGAFCPFSDGTPLSWWLDRDGVKRTYWGGFLPGVQQCSCSLDGNCRDMNYFCNCDADQDAW